MYRHRRQYMTQQLYLSETGLAGDWNEIGLFQVQFICWSLLWGCARVRGLVGWCLAVGLIAPSIKNWIGQRTAILHTKNAYLRLNLGPLDPKTLCKLIIFVMESISVKKRPCFHGNALTIVTVFTGCIVPDNTYRQQCHVHDIIL